MRSRDQVGPDVRWMSRLEAAERALGEAEQRATTASALSASRESDRMVDELIAKHAPRGLRLHWEQQQPSGRAACDVAACAVLLVGTASFVLGASTHTR